MSDQPMEVYVLLAGIIFLVYVVLHMAAVMRALRRENAKLRSSNTALIDGATNKNNDVQVLGMTRNENVGDWLEQHPGVDPQSRRNQ